jgi:xanthine dehydrogenase accessory factor
VVVREALAALHDGRPRLVGLIGEGGRGAGRVEGVVEFPMTCHSGGTLEIYVEPYLPKRLLALIGHGPVVEAPANLGRAAVVVATHADSDEDALRRVLMSEAGYVSLVASRRRAAAIVERLAGRGVPLELTR